MTKVRPKNLPSFRHFRRRSVICIFFQTEQYLTKRTIPWIPKDIPLSNLKLKHEQNRFFRVLNFVWFLRTSTLNRDCKTLSEMIVILLERLCNYVSLAKAVIETRFQWRNAGLSRYTKFVYFRRISRIHIYTSVLTPTRPRTEKNNEETTELSIF